jgi:HEAT repeat protein
MLKRIGRVAGVREGEAARTGRLFAFIFLMTAAVALARSAQRDLFLSAYPRSRIPDAFLLSAVVLAGISLVLSSLAPRLGPRRLMLGLLLVTAAVWGLMPHIPMALYVVVEALSSLLLVQSWATAAEAVDVRSAKRLFPLVGAGASLAWILGGLAAGGARWIGSTTLLSIAPVLLVGAAGVLQLIGVYDIPKRGREAPRSRDRNEYLEGLRYILSEPLVRMMAILSLGEVLVEKLVDFQLLSMAQSRYATQAGGIASFMGLFYAVTGGLTLLAPFTFSSALLLRFGSARVLRGSQWFVLLASLLFFFVPGLGVVVFLAGGDRIFKQSLAGPARSQMFGAIPAVRRAQAGSLIRGVLASAVSIAVAAVLKAYPPGMSVRWLALGAIASMAALLLGTRKLRGTYVNALQNSVDRRKLNLDISAGGQARELDAEQVQSLEAELLSQDEGRAALAIAIASTATAATSRALLEQGLEHPSERVRTAAVEVMARSGDAYFSKLIVRALGRAQGEELQCVSLRAVAQLDGAHAIPNLQSFMRSESARVRALAHIYVMPTLSRGSEDATAAGLVSMLASPRAEERAAAAWALSQVPVSHPRIRAFIPALLEDSSVEVRRAVLGAAAHLADANGFNALVTALAEPEVSGAAFEAFARLPERALPEVAETLKDAPADLVSTAASALAGSPIKGAAELLRKLLQHEDPQVRYRASRALALRRRAGDWMPPPSEELLRNLHAELEQGHRYHATLIQLRASSGRDSEPGELERFIFGEIDSRIEETERRIMALVALIGHPRIAYFSHQLRGSSPEVTAKVLELVEQSLDEEVASLVIPFLERVPGHSDGKRPAAAVDADPLDNVLALDDPHIRRCALLVYGRKIAEKRPELPKTEEHLLHLVERIRFLRNVPLFKGLTAEDLMKLAEISEPVTYTAGQAIFKKGDLGDVMCIVVTGQVEIRDGSLVIASPGVNEFFGELAILDQEPRSADAWCVKDTELLQLGGPDLEALMERRPGIAREVIRVLTRRLRNTTRTMVQRAVSDHELPVAK